MPEQIKRLSAQRQTCTRITESIARWGRVLVSLTIVTFLSVATADAQERVFFDIEAGTAGQALNLYARQADVQIGFTTELVGSIQTNAVKGRYEPMQALSILLEGTGLTADQNDKGIVIRKAEDPRVEGKTPSSEQRDPERERPMQRSNAAPSATINSRQKQAYARDNQELDEIVVTGTQIRNTAPVGANVITFDRAYIESSGLGTTHEVLETVPQTYGGGSNEDTMAASVGAGTNNLAFSSSVNLRGLGSDSTLLLLNGRRSAAGGINANFVDLNSIPAAAIERIEILPDGASAIYGSDAIGGVINVVLRDRYDGAETRIRYAPGTSDINEIRFSQTFGKSWSSGNALLTYEYHDRSELEARDRIYTANSDLRNLGGTNSSSPSSNPGNITRYISADGSSVNVQLAIPEGQDGTDLTIADLLPGVNLQNTQENTWALPKQERNTVAIHLNHEHGDNLNLFFDSRYSRRSYEHLRSLRAAGRRINVPQSNPWFLDLDPSGGAQSLTMDYSFGDDFGAPRSSGTVSTAGATAGTTYTMTDSWELEFYGSYNSETIEGRSDQLPNTFFLNLALADDDPNTAFNPFGDGSHTNSDTLRSIEGSGTSKTESVLKILNALADGNLLTLRGGYAKLAIGAQFRDESLNRSASSFTSTPEPVESTSSFDRYDLHRNVASAFAELYLPIAAGHDGTSSGRMAVSLAARYERYSDFGDTVDPKLGISWSPNRTLTLRGTIGTSFRAPLLKELDDSNRSLQMLNVTSFGGPPGYENVIFIVGNSPDLDPQEGTTWTAGFDVTPPRWSDFKLGLTYFSTEVENLIDLPGASALDPFRQPDVYASILTLDPDDSLASALLAEPVCNCGAVEPGDVDAIVDFRNGNLAHVELSGLDFNAGYRWESVIGNFDLSLYASHLFEFKDQLAGAPLVDRVNTVTNPTSIKLRGSLSWRLDGMTASLFVNHTGDYADTLSDPPRKIDSWTTWDFTIGREFDHIQSVFLANSRIAVSVQNVFDRNPPFIDATGGFGYDSNNANPLGRFLSIQLTKDWCGAAGC